jgi:tRNA threonylcarbamoyladenosine biosynthesis protein TsaB
VPTADVSGGTAELVTPENFRNWTPLPGGVRRVPYALAELLPRTAEADLFQPTDAPDAFLHEEPSYVMWTPQIHRAPGGG